MESTMSIIETSTVTQAPKTGNLDFKLEVVIVPVSDAERTKRFFTSLGWREDADFVFTEDFRVLQFTPPGSDASVIFGTGVTDAVPGSAGRILLAVDDVEAARAELIERGVAVSDVFHGVAFDVTGSRNVPGPDPERGSYKSYATFTDPDGNEFLLQEVTTRLPGRVDQTPVAELAELLLETAMQHDHFEKASAPHQWWDWYAPYLAARQEGKSPEQATEAADRYMSDERGIVRQQ
jgi:catechol 2,3-dioxygenase-like lactoylglutathione lyase family enzyme